MFRNFVYDGLVSLYVAHALAPVKTQYGVITLDAQYQTQYQRVFVGPDDKATETQIAMVRGLLQQRANRERWFFSPQAIVNRFVRRQGKG